MAMGRLASGAPPVGWAEDAARFVRLFSMGATILYPLVGLATASQQPIQVSSWLGLVLCGVLFHVFADVGNDVSDLPLDRTDPRKVTSPLVRGRVRPAWAMVIAIAALPGIAIVLLGEEPGAATALAAAVALIGAYNVIGKTIPIPLVADLVQGAGWAALVFLGAEVGGGATAATYWAAAFVMVYVAMVNGVHGAVRDVETDRAAGASTTAVLLGAEIRAKDLLLPPALVTHAGVLQATLGVTLIGVVLAGQGDASGWRMPGTVMVFAASTWKLVEAFRHRHQLPEAMADGTWHLFLVPAGLLIASHDPTSWLTAASIVAYVAPPWLFGRAVRGSDPFPPSLVVPTDRVDAVSIEVRLAGLWEMTRIGVPVAAAVLVVVGSVIGGKTPSPVVAAMVTTALTAAGANVYNDRCDLPADQINRPDRALPSGRVRPNDADRCVLGLGCGAFASAAPLGMPAMAATGLLAVAGLLYSGRLKRMGVIGQFAAAGIFATPILYGGEFVAGRLEARHWIAVFLIAAMVFARETLKVIPDREGDLAAGYRTLATRYDDATVLTIFHVTAVVLVLGSLAVTWHVTSLPYLASAIVCIVTPTAMAARRVRGTPADAEIKHATARFGRVFGLGMIPLFIIGMS